MKNKTFIQSIMCAIKGMIYALKTEKNFAYYGTIAIIFLVINFIVKIEFNGYIFYIITSIGVFASECMNTAIERTCNRITKKTEDEIKIIKDISAGTVLYWGIAFFIIEFIFIGKAIIL